MSKSTKNQLPEFKSIDEEAEFWDTHDSTDYLDGVEEVQLEVVRPLIHAFRVETDARTLDRLYALAQREGLSSGELATRWIKERLEQEAPEVAEQPRLKSARPADQMTTESGFNPVDSYMFLADGGGALDLDPPDSFWAQLMGGREMSESTRQVAEAGGWLLSGYELEQDMTHWEMHPQGNEILYMLTGACDVVLDEPAGERVISVSTGQACVVPQGIWHRQVVIEPGRILAITYGRGTEHRPR